MRSLSQHVDADAEDHARAACHQRLHLAHRLRQAVEQRARDDGVADVQLDDLAACAATGCTLW